MRDIYDYSFEELKDYIEAKGMRKFRAQQLFTWLYKKRVDSFEKMTDLAKDFRKMLEAEFHFSNLEVVSKQVAGDGTTKYLFKLFDNHLI